MDEIYNRWPTAADFYRERDDRTLREVQDLAQYATRDMEILVDPLQAHTSSVQQIALLASNLTARWARRVRVVVPDVPLAPTLVRGLYFTLRERILGEMRSADPFGDFQVVLPEIAQTLPHAASPLRLFVGPWCDAVRCEMSAEDYLVHACSWTAVGQRGAGLRFETVGPATSAAAGLAASLGVADLFKRAVGHRSEDWLPSFAWCTWSHSVIEAPWEVDTIASLPVPNSLDFGRALLAGVGAIGSALIYLADLMPLCGYLTLLDRDCVELSNLNRSPLFQVRDVLARAEKTAVAERYLSSQQVDIRTATGTWREHAAQLAGDPYDVWISLTNEDGAWAEVPYQLPPIVIHGTTTSGWGFGAGRHIPRREDCTLCRLPRPTAEFRGPCAEGEIVTSVSTPIRASLPFLSAASAALVLAELLKLGSAYLPALPNDISADLRFGLPMVITLTRLHNSACRGCRASLSSLWLARGGKGRYRSYSEAA